MSETKNLKLFKHEEPLETNNNKFDIDKALNKNWDKVDDYAGEANSKIDLITEIIDLLPKVSNKGESITLENTARAKFTKFRTKGNSNQETREESKSTVTGTEVTVNDTYINNQTKFNIDGNSYQETTEGYNILQNIVHKNDENYITNGITFTKNSDGSIVANGTATANARYAFVSESGTRENIKAGAYRITGCASGGSTSSYRIVIGITGVGEKYEDGNGINITISSDTTYYFGIFIREGQTVSDLVFKPMIVSGTEDKPYETYTGGIPSPNPDYPQEITNVGENAIKIKQSGKNLFDKSTANVGKTLNAQGELQGDSGGEFSTSDYIDIEPDTNYYLYNVLPTYYVRTCAIYDDNKNFIKIVILTGSNVGNLLILTPANAKYIRITYKTSDVDIVQVTKGTNLLPYEPYHEPIITPINLQGNILSKVGDVKDILRVNRNGEVEIKKNIGKIVLDGSENWKGYEEFTNTVSAYLSITDLTKTQNSNILCNKFKKLDDYEQDKEGIIVTPYSAVLIAIKINKSRLTENSLSGIKTWLSQHPTEVYYGLATPQIITLPSITPIELWQGTNIFSLVTNLDTEIELEYNYIPQSPSPEAPSEIKNVKDNINIKIADKNNEEQQEILFPLVQGQKLMQGDYLADDGIHHTKAQIQLDGITYGLRVERVALLNTSNLYYCVIEIPKHPGVNGINNMYCSHLIPYNGAKTGSCYITNYGKYIVIVLTDQTITTVDVANTWLATQKEKGTPVVIEYKLAEEEIETYTEVQKEAHEQIKNAISYKGQTNIFSTNEIKPIFEVEALADIGLLLNNMQAQILAGGE